MAIEVFNRYESKFLINKNIYEDIQKELLKYMEFDDYNRLHEFYTISNIYYDTKDNHLIRTSLSKPQYKEKLRIRAYGVPEKSDKVYLEVKKKVCGMVNKRRTTLKLQEAYDFVNTGKKPKSEGYMNAQVIREIEYILKVYDLEPKLYLAYDRLAMFGRNNRNFRITFDTNIRTRRYDLGLEKGDYGEMLMEDNQWLMELKLEKNIPLWLSKLLSEYKVYNTSFSKYGRVYEEMLQNEIRLKGENKICSSQYLVQPQIAHQFL